MNLTNTTEDLDAIIFRHVSHDRRNMACCVAKASFSINTESGRTFLLPENPELAMSDEYRNPDDVHSLSRESDIAPFKPRSDIYFVNPVAHAPNGIPQTHWPIEVRVGSLHNKCVVTGKRTATKELFGWNVSPIEPAVQIELNNAIAFGGVSDSEMSSSDGFCEDNPIGVCYGIDQARRGTIWNLPQVGLTNEIVKDPMKNLHFTGLCPIPKSWKSRLRFAGTIEDDAGKINVLPQDFDSRFYNAAPASFQYPGYLMGNESVSLKGLHPDGDLDFQLPVDYRVGLLIKSDDGKIHLSVLRLDTLVFDIPNSRFDLTWRNSFLVSQGKWQSALVKFPWTNEVSDAA